MAEAKRQAGKAPKGEAKPAAKGEKGAPPPRALNPARAARPTQGKAAAAEQAPSRASASALPKDYVARLRALYDKEIVPKLADSATRTS